MNNTTDLPDDSLQALHIGISAINPMAIYNASARNTMSTTQMSQKITLLRPDVALVQHGFEEDLAKGTLNVKVPEDCVVKAIIRRRQRGELSDSVLIYRELYGRQRLGVIHLPTHLSLHNRQGFSYVPTKAMKEVREGKVLKKGTILLDSPSVGPDGDEYNASLNLNLALVTHPSTAEDGIGICSDVLPRLAYHTFETIRITIDENQCAATIYPNGGVVPEVGDVVRDDNIIMVIKTIDPHMLPIQATEDSLSRIDYIEDDIHQVHGVGPAVVLECNVIRNKTLSPKASSMTYGGSTTEQLDILNSADDTFHSRIIAVWRKELATNSVTEATEELNSLLVKAKVITGQYNPGKNERIKMVYKGVPLSAYTIDITVRREVYPNFGSKGTDRSSAKGVITSILPPEVMPVDVNGRRADILMAPEATAQRTIVGKTYDHYLSDVAATTGDRIRMLFGMDRSTRKRDIYDIVSQVRDGNPTAYQHALTMLIEVYDMVNPVQAQVVKDNLHDPEFILTLLVHVCTHDAVLVVTVDTAVTYGVKNMIKRIEASAHRPAYAPVTMVVDGVTITTNSPIRIAPIAFFILEKDASEFSATNTMQLSSLGFVSIASKADKQVTPIANKNISSLSQDETTIMSGVLTAEQMAEYYDYHSNPTTHATIVENMLNAQKPSGQDKIVDRKLTPIGETSSMRMVNHILRCWGSELKYEPDQYNTK